MADEAIEKRRLPTAERKVRDAARKVDADMAMAEHRENQRRIQLNRERLRAERLARESEGSETS